MCLQGLTWTTLNKFSLLFEKPRDRQEEATVCESCGL
jgi:hypothetical protein